MRTGDTVTDERGRTYTIEQRLGRGSWGVTWLIRDENDRTLVLKLPVRAADVPADAPIAPEAIAAARTAASEQAALLRKAPWPWLPRLESTVSLEDGSVGLVMPHYQAVPFEKLALSEALDIVLRIARDLKAAGRPHGALRESNVLLNERGEPVVTDVVTDVGRRAWPAWSAAAPRERENCRPPEADGPPRPGWDTWALCQLLYRAANGTRDPMPASLDKVALTALKDRCLERLKADTANRRFVTRVATRLGALLNRGLSQQFEPSPPYRFRRLEDLVARLEEVVDLVDPRVEEVGRLLCGTDARDDIFLGGAPVAFSISVAASEGVGHEDVACGVAVHDLDADADAPGGGRVHVDDLTYSVKTHPSGRMRFQFKLPDMQPGRYDIRVAFSVRDGGHEPVVSEGRVEVRPPPGWIPPSRDLPKQAVKLQTPSLDEARPMRRPQSDDIGMPEIPGEVIEGMFPTPIAPTSPGITAPPAPALPAPERRVAVAAAPPPEAPPLFAVPTPPPTDPSVPSTAPRVAAVARPAPTLRVAGVPSSPIPSAGIASSPIPSAGIPSAGIPSAGIASSPAIAMPSPTAPPPVARPTPAPLLAQPSIARAPAPSAPVAQAPLPQAQPQRPPMVAVAHPVPTTPTSAGYPEHTVPSLEPPPAPLPTPAPSFAPPPTPVPSIPISNSLGDPEELFFANNKGADLPTWDASSPRTPAIADKLLGLIRGDSYTAVVVASSIAFGMLVLAIGLTRACS